MAPKRSQVVGHTTANSAGGESHGFGYESPSDEYHEFVFDIQPSHNAQNELGNTRTHGPSALGLPSATSISSPSPSPSHYSAAARRPAFQTRQSHNLPLPESRSRPLLVGYGPPAQYSINTVMASSEKFIPDDKVGFCDRISCYQWTYFTMTMATGGVANMLHSLSYKAGWITGIGTFFFLLNIVLFITNCICISTRFYLRPGSLINSFTDQVESLFIPAFFVSIAIIMINICEYGVPHAGVWLLRTVEVMFWIYVGLSVFASAGMYLILWSTMIFPVHMMTPTWVFPAYPLLLTAPFAGNLIAAGEVSKDTLSLNTTAVAVCAAAAQGTGCLIAFMISAAFVYRLMTQKLPRDMQRPGVFISIGPFGFTAAGIAQLGSQAQDILPENFLGVQNSVGIIKVLSILVALWLWGLSMWFFLVSVGSLWKYTIPGHKLPFQMTWWSFVFPNTAMVTATQIMGGIFESKGLQIFGCVMTVVLIVVWIGVFTTMLYCLKTKRLLWPKSEP